MGTTSGDAGAAKQAWPALMVAGTIAVIAGILAIALPAAASVSITILIGILLIVVAVVWLIGTLRSDAGAAWKIIGVVLALLLLVAGIWALARPFQATVTFTAILVIYFIVSGVIRLAGAIADRRREGAFLWGLGGALSIVLGILIGTELPDSANWAIGLLVGIQFLFDGFALLAIGFSARKVAKAA
ncbi:MAG: DUF308 domain-containing protein [Thermoleophilia bacterium]|nr:DUF308 domain-containing protein [Thermoleophilia bacterium]